MAKLYIVIDVDHDQPAGIYPSKKKAEARIRSLREVPIDTGLETVDVPMTREGVCEFIERRFGGELFE